jgi:hypothetical protein
MRFLARHGWFIAIAVTYLYVFPYFPKIHSANELPRVYLVKAIADDHTFAIDRGVQRWKGTADVSPSGGHQYSNKAPGSSMLAAPPYLAVRLVAGEPGLEASMWIARVFAGIVPALLFLLLMYRFLERYVPDPAIRQLVCIAYGLGSMAMTYSILFYSHQLAAACIASAWIFGIEAAERRRGLFAFAIAGGLAGAAALVDYQAVFAAVPIAVHVMFKLWSRPRRELLAAIAVAIAGAAVPIAILLAYHTVCFGGPLRTGYDASTTFAFHHQEGFLGLTKLRWEAFYGSLVKIDNGLFALAPWLLLALPGLFWLARGSAERAALVDARAFWRGTFHMSLGLCSLALGVFAYAYFGLIHWSGRISYATIFVPMLGGVIAFGRGARHVFRGGERGAAAVALAVLVIYVLFISGINFWRGGWGVGPRYITAMLPFLLPPIAVALAVLQRWNRVALGAVAGTIVVGVAIYTLSAVTFPYWPDSVKHPLYDVTFRLLSEGLAAPNLASALGVEGVLGIVPIVLLVAGLLGWAIHRVAGWLGLAMAVVVAAYVLGAYGLLPHGGPHTDRPFKTVRNAVLDL